MESILQLLDGYNVVWKTPGRSDRSFMPLGNGEVTICLWVEEDGDLQFYIGRSDALTELERNVKLGKVRVSLSPNPFRKGNIYCQELILREGKVEIKAGKGDEAVSIRIFVDSENPTIYVEGDSISPLKVKVKYETWRTNYRPPYSDSPISANSPVQILESPDTVRTDREGILFYHRNGQTSVPFHAELQGLADYIDVIPDTLTNRIFGGYITMTDAASTGDGQVESVNEVHSFAIKVSTHSEQVPQVEEWIDKVLKSHLATAEPLEAEKRTSAYWETQWLQSWMFIEGDHTVSPQIDAGLFDVVRESFPEEDAPKSKVTQAYLLTRWINMCSSNVEFPVLFNGGTLTTMPGGNQHYSYDSFGANFTSMPTGEPNIELNPDERSWAHFNLWQNIRLPYHSMLARGELEPIRKLFRHYRRFWELDRVRAKLYHSAEGQHNTEMPNSFGLLNATIYGLERDNLPIGYSQNRWGGAIDISPGLELSYMMLSYYEFTSDDMFLQEEILPYSKELLYYVATRFKERVDGKINISPIHSIETYFDTTDALPVVAGMHAVIDKILDLPQEKVMDRMFYEEMKRLTPEIPMETINGQSVLAPARIYEPKRMNVEAPQFYAIFPFSLFGHNKPDLDMAIRSYRHALEVSGGFRPFTLGRKPDYASYSGWQQTGMVAALLGLTEDARTVLVQNCQQKNPGFRFPAMWGPIYDAVPDIDHGANILNTLQLMAFQIDGEKIHILPAWPKEWNVTFKFNAPHDTTVECVFSNGEITKLEVSPIIREKDIIVAVQYRK